MDLSSCMLIVRDLHPQDRDAVLARLDALTGEGMSAREAQRQAVADVIAGLEAQVAPAAGDIDQELEQRGEPVVDSIDAERRWNDGQRLFGFHEQDDSQPVEITSLDMLRSYAPDQLIALPRGAQFSRRQQGADIARGINRQLTTVSPASVQDELIELGAQAVQDWIDEGAPVDAGAIPLGRLPHVLTMLTGGKAQALLADTSVLRKVLIDKHADDVPEDVTPEQFIRALYDPAMVLSERGKGEYEVVSQMLTPSGLPLVFAIKTNATVDGTKMPVLMSAYARSALWKPTQMQAALATRAVKYANLAAMEALAGQSPAVARAFGRAAPSAHPSAALPRLTPGAAVASPGQSGGGKTPTSGFALPSLEHTGGAVPGHGGGQPGNRAVQLTSLAAAINSGSVAGTGDLVNFLGSRYEGAAEDMPRYSARRQGQFELRDFGLAAKVIEAQQDRYNRWKQSIEDVRKQGGVITEANDFYLAEERYWGRVGAQLDDFEHEMKAFAKALAADGLDFSDLASYVYARHAHERNDWIAQQRASMPDGGSGMTDADAQATLDSVRAAGLEPVLEKHAATLDRWIAGTRDILHDNGLIDDDEYNAWATMFQHYVPLRGLEGKAERRGTGQGFNIRGKEGKRAFGRRSEAKQIIEQIVQDRTRALIRSGKNEVLRSFAQFVLDNPDPALWEINAVERKPVATVDAFGNRIIDEQTRIIDDNRTVTVKDGGREIHILVNDQPLREQLQNLHVENIGRFLGSLLWVNRLLSRTYTSLSPTFLILNAARDITAATLGIIDDIGFMAVPGLYARLPSSWWQATKAEFGAPSPEYDVYRHSGGKTGFFDYKDVDRQAAELRDIMTDAERVWFDPRWLARATLSLIEKINGGVENATRYAAFRTAMAHGKTVAEAAHISKNITVNFNRKGTATAGMSAWFLFYNPAVQGTARMLQALHNPKVVATLGTAMLGIAALALRNAAMGDDDDGVAWWDKIPPETKERSLIIVLPPTSEEGEPIPGSKTGRYIKIPMPYGYNFFAVVANQLVDVWRHSQDARRGANLTTAGVRSFQAFMGSWVPAPEVGRSFENTQSALLAAVPDALSPVAQNVLNVNAFGRKMYPDYPGSDRKPDSSRYFTSDQGTIFQRASELMSRAAGGTAYRPPPGVLSLFDMTPAGIENLVRGYGGGPASFGIDLLNALYVRQSIQRPEPDVRRLPFVKQLYGVIDDETDRMIGYERLFNAEDKAAILRDAKKGGARDEVRDMLADPEFAVAARLGGQIRDARKHLTTLRKQEQAILANDKLGDNEKYVRLRLINQHRRRVLQRFNEQWGRASEAAATAAQRRQQP